MSLAAITMGDTEDEMASRYSGKFFSTNDTNAGQHDVVITGSAECSAFSLNSRASLYRVMSAPRAASTTWWNPSCLMAVTTCPMRPKRHWLTMAGAMTAYTRYLLLPSEPLRMSIMSSTCDLSVMAPKGQLTTQAPHDMHFVLSMTALSSLLMDMAFTLQLFMHGRCWAMMALYGHACEQRPHSMHLFLSIVQRWLTIVMASRGHTSLQACIMHPRHASVTSMPAAGHSSHAISMTCTGFGLSLSPPMAICMRSCTMALSLYMQQLSSDFGPGLIILGISRYASSSPPS